MVTALHDNRLPAVDPTPLVRWAYTDTLPASAHDEAINNKTVFMNWFNSEILAPVDDVTQCSSSFLLYPGSRGQGSQWSRNWYIGEPGIPFQYGSARISSFSECPDSVFPVGQASGFSDVTQHEEFYPVTVNVMVAKGCDGLLAKLAQDLVEAGIVVVPQVGQTINGGEILMRR